MNPLLIGPIFDIIKDALGRVLPDPEAKAKAQAAAMDLIASGTYAEKAQQAINLAQIDVNKADASSSRWWQAGWRPFIGWTCGGALFCQYIVGPFMPWLGAVIGHPMPELPRLDDQLWQLLAGMLGLGALRTVEKVKGAA